MQGTPTSLEWHLEQRCSRSRLTGRFALPREGSIRLCPSVLGRAKLLLSRVREIQTGADSSAVPDRPLFMRPSGSSLRAGRDASLRRPPERASEMRAYLLPILVTFKRGTVRKLPERKAI